MIWSGTGIIRRYDLDPDFCKLLPTKTAVKPSTGSLGNSFKTYSTVFLTFTSSSKAFNLLIFFCRACLFKTPSASLDVIVSSKSVILVSDWAFLISF